MKIQIYTTDEKLVSDIVGKDPPSGGEVVELGDKVKLKYTGSVIRKGYGIPEIANFMLDVTSKAADIATVLMAATWLFKKIKNRIAKMTIEGKEVKPNIPTIKKDIIAKLEFENFKPLDPVKFALAVKEFDEIEKRGSYYTMAVDLLSHGFEIKAYLFLLATWNFARFRYAIKNFDIKSFQDTMEMLDGGFKRFENREFRSINFDDYEDEIECIFNTLAGIPGIEFTGASKIMHLKKREVFVMWDDYIGGRKPKKFYDHLQIVKDGFWKFKKYEKNGSDYFQFLKDMQLRFKDFKFEHTNKTFPKAIDEFNYTRITLPIQMMEKKRRRRKK